MPHMVITCNVLNKTICLHEVKMYPTRKDPWAPSFVLCRPSYIWKLWETLLYAEVPAIFLRFQESAASRYKQSTEKPYGKFAVRF